MFLHFVDCFTRIERTIRIDSIVDILMHSESDNGTVVLINYLRLGKLQKAHIAYPMDMVLDRISYTIINGGVTERLGEYR